MRLKKVFNKINNKVKNFITSVKKVKLKTKVITGATIIGAVLLISASSYITRIRFTQTAALPSSTQVGDLIVYNDTSRIYQYGAWHSLYNPFVDDSTWTSTSTDTIYTGGSRIKGDGSSLFFYPVSSWSDYIYFSSFSGNGYFLAGIGEMLFSINGYSQDRLRGFRNDTSSFSADTTATMSINAIRELVYAHEGTGGSVDFTGIPDSVLIYADGDTASYDTNLKHSDYGILFGNHGDLRSNEFVVLHNTDSDDSIAMGSGTNGITLMSPLGEVILDGFDGINISTAGGNIDMTSDLGRIYLLAPSSYIQLQSNNVQIGGDSILIDSIIIFNDSIYYPIAADAENDHQWMFVRGYTHAVDVDSISNSGWAYNDKLEKIGTYLSDIKIDKETGFIETKWGHWNGKEVVYEYNIKGSPNEVIQKLQGGIEHSYRYIAELTENQKKLENRIEKLENKNLDTHKNYKLITFFSLVIIIISLNIVVLLKKK